MPTYGYDEIIKESSYKFEYDWIVVMCRTEQQVLDLQRLLFNNGYHWPSTIDTGTTETEYRFVGNDYDEDQYPVVIYVGLTTKILLRSNSSGFYTEEEFTVHIIGLIGRWTRITREGETIDPHIYEYTDPLVNKLIIQSIDPPNYNPRKIIRESREEYKYDEICYEIKDKDEAVKIYTFLQGEKFSWFFNISYTPTNNPMYNSDFYPRYLFANLKENNLSTVDSDFDDRSDNIYGYIDSWNEEHALGIQDTSIDPQVYNSSTYNTYKEIVLKGEKIKFPNYSPRTIIRESIDTPYFKKYQAIFIRHHNNKEEIEYIYDLGIKYGFKCYDDKDTFVINVVGANYDNGFVMLNADDGQIYYGYNTFYYKYEKIYDFSEVDVVENILKYGRKSPTYNPKKIIREHNSFNYEYDELIVKIDNMDESRLVQELAFKYGIGWETYQRYQVKEILRHYPCAIFIDLANKLLYYNRLNDFVMSYLKKEYVDPKLWNFNELDKIRNILKYGRTKPSYEPKKIIRESAKYKYQEICYRINNDNDRDLIYSFLTDENYNCYGIFNLDSKFIFIRFKHKQAFFMDFSPIDIPDYIDSCNENGFGIDTHIYDKNEFDTVKRIIRYGEVVPSYKPRKIIRESMSRDKYNKRYFVFKCDLSNFVEVQDMLINHYGFLWKISGNKIIQAKNLGIIERYYIVIDVHEKIMTYKISPMGSKYMLDYIKDKYGDDMVYGQVFDKKSIHSFSLLLKNELYAPKQIPNNDLPIIEKFNMKGSLDSDTVLYAFDMDDTLVYGNRFESYVKYLIMEYLTPEQMITKEVEDIGITMSDLKYDNGRIYFDDKSDVEIPVGSDWVRKKDRIYLKQPEMFFMSDYSLPVDTYDKIVKLYKKAKNKCIITARKDFMRQRTEIALTDLGIDEPNYGLYMYPSNEFLFKSRWKIDVILNICGENGFNEVHYFDDNIKLIKKMKDYYKNINSDINIYFYKVHKNDYREI